MSVLSGKRILVVGDETSQIHNVEALLKQEEMVIKTTTCDSVTVDKLHDDNVDIILLNHLHAGASCVELLSRLRKRRAHHEVPIISVVEDTPAKIDEALALGSADFITSDENIESIVLKFKRILGEPDSVSNTDLFDISSRPTNNITDSIKVLVVEDDSLLRNLVSTRLDKAGFEYRAEPDGADILNTISDFEPNIVLLDLMLPERDGFELLREIRENKDTRKLPVIVFSNRDSQDDRRKAMDLGISGYYVKAMTDLADLMTSITVSVRRADTV